MQKVIFDWYLKLFYGINSAYEIYTLWGDENGFGKRFVYSWLLRLYGTEIVESVWNKEECRWDKLLAGSSCLTNAIQRYCLFSNLVNEDSLTNLAPGRYMIEGRSDKYWFVPPKCFSLSVYLVQIANKNLNFYHSMCGICVAGGLSENIHDWLFFNLREVDVFPGACSQIPYGSIVSILAPERVTILSPTSMTSEENVTLVEFKVV